MGIMVYPLLWVIQGLHHKPYPNHANASQDPGPSLPHRFGALGFKGEGHCNNGLGFRECRGFSRNPRADEVCDQYPKEREVAKLLGAEFQQASMLAIYIYMYIYIHIYICSVCIHMPKTNINLYTHTGTYDTMKPTHKKFHMHTHDICVLQ